VCSLRSLRMAPAGALSPRIQGRSGKPTSLTLYGPAVGPPRGNWDLSKTCPTAPVRTSAATFQGQATAFGHHGGTQHSPLAAFASSASELTPASASDFKMYCRPASRPRSDCGDRVEGRWGFCQKPTRKPPWAVASRRRRGIR